MSDIVSSESAVTFFCSPPTSYYPLHTFHSFLPPSVVNMAPSGLW